MNILGTEYDLVFDSSIKLSDEADGICQSYSKRIIVRPLTDMLDDSDKYEEKKNRYDEVLRHEIIHAFFFEAGIDELGTETLVNWMAVQFPKMLKLFRELNCAGEEERKNERGSGRTEIELRCKRGEQDSPAGQG